MDIAVPVRPAAGYPGHYQLVAPWQQALQLALPQPAQVKVPQG
jgi:hypothetical protein